MIVITLKYQTAILRIGRLNVFLEPPMFFRFAGWVAQGAEEARRTSGVQVTRVCCPDNESQFERVDGPFDGTSRKGTYLFVEMDRQLFGRPPVAVGNLSD